MTHRSAIGHGGQPLWRHLTTLALVLFLVYSLLPLYYLVVSSTKSNSDLFSTFGLWIGEDFHLSENIRALLEFEDGLYKRWLLNSAWYSTMAAGGAALVASLAGYAFAKFEFPGRRLLFGVILGAMMVPNTALVIPQFLLLARTGLVDTPWAVILPSMVFPLGVYLMRVYIDQAVPDEILDAARIDGAGEVTIFFRIVAWLVSPGFVTVFLLAFTASWNNYFLPLVVLTTPANLPVTVGLAHWYNLASAGSGGQALFSLVITGALAAILPVGLVFLLMQRYWKAGLASGGVK